MNVVLKVVITKAALLAAVSQMSKHGRVQAIDRHDRKAQIIAFLRKHKYQSKDSWEKLVRGSVALKRAGFYSQTTSDTDIVNRFRNWLRAAELMEEAK